VQRSAAQCSAVQRSAAQCSAVQRSAAQCSAVQRSAAQCSASLTHLIDKLSNSYQSVGIDRLISTWEHDISADFISAGSGAFVRITQ